MKTIVNFLIAITVCNNLFALTKEEMDFYETLLLDRGMATLPFDGPGQGEAEYDLPIRGDFEVPVKAVVDYIESRPDLDASRVAIMGVSLGGYYAARAAAFEKRLKACLSLSGPYSWVEVFDARNELSRGITSRRRQCATTPRDSSREHRPLPAPCRPLL